MVVAVRLTVVKRGGIGRSGKGRGGQVKGEWS